jgi:hypothetical protein
MVCIGEDQTYTAMAKQLVYRCNGDLTYLKWENYYPWVQLPIRKEVYLPI